MAKRATQKVKSLTMRVRDKKQFPICKGTYEVLSPVLRRRLYAGKACGEYGFRERWRRHHRYPQARRINAWVRFYPMPGASKATIKSEEDWRIDKYSPPWNGTTPPRPHWAWVDALGLFMDRVVVVAVLLLLICLAFFLLGSL